MCMKGMREGQVHIGRQWTQLFSTFCPVLFFLVRSFIYKDPIFTSDGAWGCLDKVDLECRGRLPARLGPVRGETTTPVAGGVAREVAWGCGSQTGRKPLPTLQATLRGLLLAVWPSSSAAQVGREQYPQKPYPILWRQGAMQRDVQYAVPHLWGMRRAVCLSFVAVC